MPYDFIYLWHLKTKQNKIETDSEIENKQVVSGGRVVVSEVAAETSKDIPSQNKCKCSQQGQKLIRGDLQEMWGEVFTVIRWQCPGIAFSGRERGTPERLCAETVVQNKE